MAWGTKYRETFDTLDGVHSYQIDFKFKGYGGGITAVELAHPFLVLKYGSGGVADLLKWNMASQAEVVVHDDSSGTFRTDISESDEDEVIIEIERDSALFWAGFVKSEIQSKPLNDTERNVTVRALCGIDLSKGRAYDNSGTNYTGREKLSVVLSRALAKIGVDLGIDSNNFASNWYPFRDSSDISGDPLNTVELNQSWLLADTGATYSAYTVMKEIASRFGMRVMQVGGKWFVTQSYLTRGASYTVYEYDASGTAVTSASIGTVTPIVVGSGVAGANDIELTVDGEITGASALRKSKTKYIHGIRDEILIENGDFEDITSSEPDNWTASAVGAGESYARGHNSTNSLAFDSVVYTSGPVANLATKNRSQSAGFINADTQMQLSGMFRALKIDAEGDGTWVNSRLSRPMFWSLSQQDLSGAWLAYDDTDETWKSVLSGVYYKNRVDALPHSWKSLKRIVAAPGTPGKVWLHLWNGVDTVDLGSSSYEIDKFLWDQVGLTPLPNGETVTKGIETTLENTVAINSKTDDGYEFILGDGPSEIHISRLTFSDGGVDIPTSGWQSGAYSGGSTTGNSIDYLWNKENLIQGRTIQKRLIGTLRLKGTSDYLPHQALSYDGSQYACTHYRLDAYRRKISVDCTETLATASVTATGWTVILKDALNIANTVTSDFTTSLDNASSFDNIAITTAPYAIGEISELDVEPLEKGLEYGSLLVVIPPGGGFISVRLDTAAAVGAETLSIDPIYLSEVLRYPAGIKLTEAEVRSAFIKTQESISLLVEGGPVCTAGGTLGSGARTSMSVSAVTQVLRSGETLTIVPADGSDPIELELSADTAIGDVSISFVSNTFAVTIGDPLYGAGNATGELRVESNRITAEITKEGEQYGLLSSGISSDTTIGIKAPGIVGALKVGDTLLHQRISTGQQSVLTVAADASATATSITVDANSVVGDEDDALTPGAIVALRLGFDGIEVEGPALYSTNFDGTFDASWNITARGTTGWAFTKTGDFAATNVLLSGSIVITGGSGIASLTDAGALATADSLDDVPNGSTYARVLASKISSGSVLLSGATGSLDDVGDGSSYGRILLTAISAGRILLAEATGSLDDLANGTYAKVLTTDISAGHILLSAATGSLDDISNGATYGRVNTTAISGGNILLSTSVGNIDDVSEGATYGKLKLTDMSAGRILILGSTGATVITGGAIQSGSIVADDITVTNLSSINSDLGAVTAGSIDINSAFVVTALGAVTASSMSITGGSITGGTINIGPDVFTVDAGGVVTASNLTVTGGSINLGSGVFTADNAGAVTSSNATLTGGSINIGPNVFTVSTGGAVIASSATVSGAITASTLTATTAGSIANLTITGDLQTSGYSVSTAGVQLSTTGLITRTNATTYTQITAGVFTASHASGTTIIAGNIISTPSISVSGSTATIAGAYIYRANGTDIPVTDGGTGSSTASGARTNLGLAIGSDVQAYDTFLNDIAGLSDPGADNMLFWDDSASSMAFLTLGSGLSIVSTELRAECYSVATGVGAETALYIPSTTQHGSAGSLYGYIEFSLGGTLKKIAIYDIS